MGYFKTFLYGDEKSIAAYALVCPGVAATVMGFFFIHKGLVPTGILEANSIAYFLVLLPLILLQIKTIRVFFSLNNKLLKSSQGIGAINRFYQLVQSIYFVLLNS